MKLEKDIERQICDYVETQLKGESLKLQFPYARGFPDRTILLPHGRTAFFEIKRPGGQLSRQQKHWITKLRRLGFYVGVPTSVDQAKRELDQLVKSNALLNAMEAKQ